MSEKKTFDPKLKVKLVKKYLRSEISLRDACRLAGIPVNSYKIFKRWVVIYENEGPNGLLNRKKRKYSPEVKLAAVLAYLHREGSGMEITKRYGLSSEGVLYRWIRNYNTHEGFKSRGSGGDNCMSKAKQTTIEERLEIVKDCLANNKNYNATALKYRCSYQQVRNWVKNYEKMGKAGLEDRRGKRIGTLPSRTPEEEMRDKLAELERRNRDLQMENDLLKKVRELEMRGRCL